MYLKEIKASGFKSFADKINLNLDDEITCIVGPNGSGKSNIVDAVKWVLGEQSIKTLRGDNNMSDVIFSGSKTRKPLNLASVTLIFDNSDNYLKVPYTEISVTRKVYRSGENEYFLNGEKCRLKDINDMFLDSGIGKYAFNIISQGEVVNIINSSPYDRRAIIEEAAGVLKYKKRKEEALKKLDKTNDNMVRIKDIIAEIDTQIEPLKTQKDSALKYLDYEEKLKDVEIALITHDLEKLNNTFHESNSKKEKLEEEIAKEMSSTSSNDAEIETIKTKINEINIKLADHNKKYVEITRELEKLNGERQILNERSKYESDNLKVHENITMLKENEYNLNNKIIAIKDDISILNNKINDINSNINNLKEEVDSNNKEKSLISNKLIEKRKNVADLEFRIKQLTDYIESGAGININARKVLSNPKLNGIHNTISNLIEVEDNYSLALSAILGGAKDYVVVDTPESAKKAINYLKENNLGRVTFFPLSVIKERFIDAEVLNSLNNQKGFIGILSDLVTYEEKYTNIVKNQLGNVILVDNIDTANRIRDIVKNKYRIVTLAGEVINVGGSITGGKIKTNSVITERYELNKYKTDKENSLEELRKLNETFNVLTEKENELNNRVFELEKNKLLYEEEKNNKEELHASINKDFDAVKKELSDLGNLVGNTIKEEEERLMNEYFKLSAKKEAMEKEAKIVLEEKDKLDAELEEKQALYKTSNSNIRDLEKLLRDYEVINSKTSVKMDNLLNILNETYQMTFEKAKEEYILEIEENIARKNVNEYKRELASIGPVNVGAIEEFDRVNTRYEFLKKQLNDLETASVTLLQIIDELDEVMKAEFIKTFKEVEVEFDKVFKELFKGGSASLKLTDEDNILETGVLLEATPPGKKLGSISLLSGGEKALTAISLLFAILNIKKIPFCLFDEIEAALDETNVDRFGSYIKKYSGLTQLLIITHKKKTMEYANTLYGITMQESGVSKLVSVKLVN